MKLGCRCGASLSDATDGLPHKAHFLPDQEWNDVWDAIDEAFVNPGPGDKEAVLMELRRRIGSQFRLAWQCQACGRLYIDAQGGELREFQPAPTGEPRGLFRSRPSPGQPGLRMG